MDSELQKERSYLLAIADERRYRGQYEALNLLGIGSHPPYALAAAPFVLVGDVVALSAFPIIPENAHQSSKAIVHQTSEEIGLVYFDNFLAGAPGFQPLDLIPEFMTDDALVQTRISSAPMPYLADDADAASGAIDVRVEVLLRTTRMRDQHLEPVRLSESTLADLYWTPAQLVAHHTSNGCNLRPGDLLGSGTISGALPGERGCLLELTRRGADPVQLPDGETRKFLENGDDVILRGWCERDGFARIGFGDCVGMILPAAQGS